MESIYPWHHEDQTLNASQGALGGDALGYRSTAVRFKNDLDVKEIVNLWAGGFAAVKSMPGRHWNECAKASDHLCSACRYVEPDWL
jgi:hypothetical protein